MVYMLFSDFLVLISSAIFCAGRISPLEYSTDMTGSSSGGLSRARKIEGGNTKEEVSSRAITICHVDTGHEQLVCHFYTFCTL